MAGRLEGKAVLITGAGSGIGEATARIFAQEGAKVAVLDIVPDRASRVSDAIKGAGGESISLPADVSSASEVEGAIQQVVDQWGRLDVIINNAAIQIMGPFHEQSGDDFDRIVAVNLKGVFHGCRYALPVMLRQGKGVILSTSSVLGLVGDPDLALYGATKGGIIALTKALAIAYGPRGIRVNCVCPGDVNTPLVKEFFDFQPDPAAARETVANEYALRRIAEPAEIGKVYAFLASDDASFVTGSHVLVEGGLLANVY